MTVPAERFAQLVRQLGITRLADITGLDVAGLPVVQAVRPFSLSNAVSQGKGSSLAAATVSAVFESAETFAAERVESFDVIVASADKLGISKERFENHLLDAAPKDWHHRPLRWVEAKNLSNDQPEMLPFELVHTAYVLPQNPYDGVFCGTTTGLAAAFKQEDAMLHGVLECIERDAIARAKRTHGFLQRRRIEPKTLKDAEVGNLIEALRSKGFILGLWHALSPVNVPVVWCHLMEAGDSRTALMPFAAEGTAARLDAASAICHAIYEAAQSRLTAISGARDDFTRRNYPKYPNWKMLEAHRHLITDSMPEVDFAQMNGQCSPLLSELLVNLEQAGHSKVYAIQLDLDAELSDVTVTKIFVPSLLPLIEG